MPQHDQPLFSVFEIFVKREITGQGFRAGPYAARHSRRGTAESTPPRRCRSPPRATPHAVPPPNLPAKTQRTRYVDTLGESLRRFGPHALPADSCKLLPTFPTSLVPTAAPSPTIGLLSAFGCSARCASETDLSRTGCARETPTHRMKPLMEGRYLKVRKSKPHSN